MTKDIISAYKKFGIENANPTRAIMRKTGSNVAQASQLVVRELIIQDRQIQRSGPECQSNKTTGALLRLRIVE